MSNIKVFEFISKSKIIELRLPWENIMDEENNSINNKNNTVIESNSLILVEKNNQKARDELKISEKIIEIDIPQTNKEILINNTNKNNNSSKDINFIDALNGLIVLILICMIALGLSERFRKF
ncbi:MAG: hypothetical protein CM15mP109_07950 [Candidatus Dadabacteria bacterium]|nr:MAG: hypothetical protein CM15mP109_07950 [Candidatus Dadabacteria bacterium]